MRVITTIAVLSASLLAAPSAFAAVRYATPTGSGGEPCNPTACSLEKAVNGAADGDEVVVGPGTYRLKAEVEIDRAITVGGAPGGPKPVIQIANHFLRLENAASTLHDVRVEVVAETLPYAVNDEAGTVERVYALSTKSAGACQIAEGTLRDSVCWGGLSVGGYTGGDVRIALRNVTASETVMGSSGSTHTEIDGANLIMDGPGTGNPADYDLGIDVTSGASATISLTHSDYATVETHGSEGTDYTFPAPGTGGNITAPPQLVDPIGGDVHELPTSATVDAGLADALLGATDLDGGARAQPACLGGPAAPDIGAYELAPTTPCPQPPPPPAPAPPAPKPSNAIVLGKLIRDPSNGTAMLAVSVPGPGSVTLGGKGIVARKAATFRAGKVELPVKATGAAAKELKAKGKVTLAAAVTFTPTGGEAATATKQVKLVRHAPRRRHRHR